MITFCPLQHGEMILKSFRKKLAKFGIFDSKHSNLCIYFFQVFRENWSKLPKTVIISLIMLQSGVSTRLTDKWGPLIYTGRSQGDQNGLLFTLGSFFISRSRPNFWTPLIHGLGCISADFFQKLIWSPCSQYPIRRVDWVATAPHDLSTMIKYAKNWLTSPHPSDE
jgi:hypothetical protein